MALAVATEAATIGLTSYAKGDGGNLGYGTAGFRTHADKLNHIMYRMGILAALRSKAKGGQAIGVMITASHNADCDNGVKLVDPMGEMLEASWEDYATMLANASDDGLAAAIVKIVEACGLASNFETVTGFVIVGRDTRAHSPLFALAVVDGASVLRPTVVRTLGLATTPQVHYIVRCVNTQMAYGVPSLLGYCSKFATAYKILINDANPSSNSKYVPKLILDCANGVGSIAIRPLLAQLSELQVQLVNDGSTGGALNKGCGADFVKVKQLAPGGVKLEPGQRLASLDGDADRLVYGFENDGFCLLDGDRIALLFAHFMAPLLKTAGLTSLRMGLVQTAYANGASTARAVEVLGKENVVCAKTGVKYCHHAALAMDIGIYFEANGHGTVIFSDAFVAAAQVAARSDDAHTANAAKKLLALRDVINETVGDAISGVLAVEAMLHLLDWSCKEWFAQYQDLPNRLIKVTVADRSKIKTTNAERTCTEPEGLQAAVDDLVKGSPQGRAFVRPSGTEDVVRIYVEAATVEATIALGKAVVDAVYVHAGGIGEKPVVV